MAHLVGENGKVADYELNSRLVAVGPGELAAECKVIGVASGEHKVPPLQAVLQGAFWTRSCSTSGPSRLSWTG